MLEKKIERHSKALKLSFEHWQKHTCTYGGHIFKFLFPQIILKVIFPISILTGVLTQHFMKHIEYCNFQTITLMYIKVYIAGMEMNQRIHF